MKWTESFEYINLVSVLLFCSDTLRSQESIQRRLESLVDLFMNHSFQCKEKNLYAFDMCLLSFPCVHPGKCYLNNKALYYYK